MDAHGIDLDEARARLENERAQLLRSLGAIDVEHIADGAISGSADAAADTASAGENRELRVELEAQLAEVDAAFERIENGTYGVDEHTGEPIDPARLEAIPTARTNV